ncbi:hypothetical protein AB7273_20190 [Providencia alcalifaciens]
MPAGNQQGAAREMKLEKGKVYDLDWESVCYSQIHNRAEYHSTYLRETDSEPMHNMIIRMTDGYLAMAVVLTADIIQLSDIQEV